MENNINNIEKTCPFCNTEIKEEDTVKICPVCSIPHHESCWEENNGCTTVGCPEQQQEAQYENPVSEGQDDTESVNNEPIVDESACDEQAVDETTEDKQADCLESEAVTETETETETEADVPEKNVCGKCGAELQESHAFCPKCGRKVGMDTDEEANAAEKPSLAGVLKKLDKKKKIVLLLAVAVIAVIVIILAAVGGGKKDFHDLYGDIASKSWCTIAVDGSYMKIDTNPYDKDSDDLKWSDYESIVIPANDKITEINKALGFSDALMEKMNTTTWSQGRQYESNDKYNVTWTYHPDKGLEVMYEFKK